MFYHSSDMIKVDQGHSVCGEDLLINPQNLTSRLTWDVHLAHLWETQLANTGKKEMNNLLNLQTHILAAKLELTK